MPPIEATDYTKQAACLDFPKCVIHKKNKPYEVPDWYHYGFVFCSLPPPLGLECTRSPLEASPAGRVRIKVRILKCVEVEKEGAGTA